MAIQLFKLAIDATTTTTVDVKPEIERYFYLLNADDREEGVLTVAAADFMDDNGDNLTGNLTTVITDNGYYMLFVNGVLQQSSLYTVTTDGSQIAVTNAETIPVGSPITLVVTNFVPTSDSDTTVTT